jgi:hypothetical protein
LSDDVKLIDFLGLFHDLEVILIDSINSMVSNGECVVSTMSKFFGSGHVSITINTIVRVSKSGPINFSVNNVVLIFESGTANLDVDNVLSLVDWVAVPSFLHDQLHSTSCLHNNEMGIVQSGTNLVAASPIASDGFIPTMPGFLAFDPQEFDGLMKKYNSLSVINELWARNHFNI